MTAKEIEKGGEGRMTERKSTRGKDRFDAQREKAAEPSAEAGASKPETEEGKGNKKRTVTSSAPENERWGEALRRAIITTAADDYRAAKAALDRDPENVSAKRVRKKCEEFFLSDVYSGLTTIDGGYVLRRLKKEPPDHSFDRYSMRVLEKYHYATEGDRMRIFYDETVSPMIEDIERDLRSGIPSKEVAYKYGVSATNWFSCLKYVPEFKKMVTAAQGVGARVRREERERKSAELEARKAEMERRKSYIKKRFKEGASAKQVGDEFGVRASTVLKFAKSNGIDVPVKRDDDGKKLLAGKEDTVKLLLDAGASHDELCKALGVSSGTLSSFISEHNLSAERPPRSVLDGKEDYIRLALSDNKTLTEIAELFHVSERTLSRYIQKNIALFALPRQAAPDTSK